MELKIENKSINIFFAFKIKALQFYFSIGIRVAILLIQRTQHSTLNGEIKNENESRRNDRSNEMQN